MEHELERPIRADGLYNAQRTYRQPAATGAGSRLLLGRGCRPKRLLRRERQHRTACEHRNRERQLQTLCQFQFRRYTLQADDESIAV